MKVLNYLLSGPSSESRLEKLADGLNFLGRYSFRTDRVDYDNKTAEFSRKKNAFFHIMDNASGSASGFILISIFVSHLVTIPFALVGACLGIPLKKYCLDKNEASKSYNVAESTFLAQQKAQEKLNKKMLSKQWIQRQLTCYQSIKEAGYKTIYLFGDVCVEEIVNHDKVNRKISEYEIKIKELEAIEKDESKAIEETTNKAAEAWQKWLTLQKINLWGSCKTSVNSR